jgi:hypothetical protein
MVGFRGTAAWLACFATGLVAGSAAAGDPARSHLLPVSEIVASSATAQGMGMTLSRASPVLRRQLALQRGAGLVVDAVTPGSRAARAGFEPHDVVVRLDDQLLVLPDQLDALLEAAEPGDGLTCTVLRGGREMALPLGGGPAAASPPRSLRPTPSTLALVQPLPASPAKSAATLRRLSDETLLREDDDYRIRVCRGDQTRLTVADRTGRVVFDEAIDSPAARLRVPEPVRGRVSEMVRLLEPQPAAPGDPRTDSHQGERIGRLDLPPVQLH